MAPKWPPCRTAPEYFQYPAGRFILPAPLAILSTSRRCLSFPPLLHRSPTLSRVHSCLLVARTSLPAVNGFLLHPSPPIRSPSIARAIATVFRSIFLLFSFFSFLFLFFSFFKTCRLTEARRSFIRFSGPVFSARITKRFLGPSGRIVIQRGEGRC